MGAWGEVAELVRVADQWFGAGVGILEDTADAWVFRVVDEAAGPDDAAGIPLNDQNFVIVRRVFAFAGSRNAQ